MSETLSVKRVYTLCKPQGEVSAPLFYDSPHSGMDYPDDFNFDCEKPQLDRLADLYIDELFGHVSDQGAVFLKAEFPRSYIDVNRHEDDVDTLLIEGLWSKPVYPKGRANSGYGIVYRLAKGEPIYKNRLPLDILRKRIKEYYNPYHTAVSTSLSWLHEQFGQVYHINCHSMPSMHKFLQLPDIVLSDRNGSTCSPTFLYFVKELLQAKNYSVGINHPYKGGEILRKYGKPSQNIHSLQIEINRALYMDENTLEKNRNYATLQKDLKEITGQLSETLISSSEKLLAAD